MLLGGNLGFWEGASSRSIILNGRNFGTGEVPSKFLNFCETIHSLVK
jgi:hypothetical protein